MLLKTSAVDVAVLPRSSLRAEALIPAAAGELAIAGLARRQVPLWGTALSCLSQGLRLLPGAVHWMAGQRRRTKVWPPYLNLGQL